MQGKQAPGAAGSGTTGTHGHTPQEIADLLRNVDFALSQGITALIAFGDRKYIDAVGRDCARMQRARDRIGTALEHLPSAIPLTDEEMTKVGRVVGTVLDKRFGDGSQEAVDAAMHDWLES